MRIIAALVIASGALLRQAPAWSLPLIYPITPAGTTINFAVDLLGLASAEGEFGRFSGRLTLDLQQPDLSAVEVSIDTSSAVMGWEPADSMVLGESYLDSAHYPEMRFESRTVTPLAPGRVRLGGMLTLRGISHWESFDTALGARRWNAERGAFETDFTAVGAVRRSDYHMAEGQGFMDDSVTFSIRVRLLVDGDGLSPAPLH